jgi:glycosyltransferase 2 family protein
MPASLNAMEPVTSPRRKIPSWAPQTLGYLVSAACLIWVLHGYPIKQDLLPAIRDLDWKWVALGVGLDLSAYLVQGWRWKTLLQPVIRLGFWRTVQAIFIGLFANAVLPLRTGELIRCYLLAHWNNLRISLSFASAAVERVIDGVFLVASFLITAGLIRSIPKDLTILVQILGVLLISLVLALMWIVTRKQAPYAPSSESKWAATFRHVVEGLHLMGNPLTLGRTTAISLLYMALQFGSLWALMKAYELDLSFWSAAGVVTIVRLWTVVPSAPANLGLLNAACYAALRGLDVEPDVAQTFSIIMFAAWTLPLAVCGAIATALTGSNIGELHKRAKYGVQTAPPRGPGL